MASPSPTWSTKRVHGEWRNPATAVLEAGWYRVELLTRVVNTQPDRAEDADTLPEKIIFRVGLLDTGTLNTTVNTAPSFDKLLPITDDPDNFPASGSRIRITIGFASDSTQEVYEVPISSALPASGLDLADVILPVTFDPAPVLIRNVPGGIAVLNDAGLVQNADGSVAGTGGGGYGSGTYGGGTSTGDVFTGHIDWANVDNKPTSYPVTQSSDLADGIIVNADVAASAAIALSKTVDTTAAPGRLAMTNAERTKLASLANSSPLSIADIPNSTEDIQDLVGLMFPGGAYNDTTGQITISGSGTDPTFRGTVTSQAAMLGLTAVKGDYCVRSDLAAAGMWMLNATPATVLANWVRTSVGPNVETVPDLNIYQNSDGSYPARPTSRTTISFTWWGTVQPTGWLNHDVWRVIP